MISKLPVFFLFIFLFFSQSAIAANQLDGEKIVSLVDLKGEAFVIAKINFKKVGDKVTYYINMNDPVFSNEFLSMRPYQCIRQPKQMLCHLVYPYKKLGHITKDDMLDLEYDFLFLHKSPEEYGIDAWNGVYYDMSLTETGLKGILKEVDLNVLAAAPEDGKLRPVTKDMLHEAVPENHLYPELLIN